MMVRAAALLMATAPALAQDPPRVTPSRDVSVTYRVQGAAAEAIPGGIPGTLRLFWNAAGQKLRAEAEGRPQSVLVDLQGHSALILDSVLRAALTLPVRRADLQPLTLNGARLTRRGQQMVAGLPCTAYGVASSRGAGEVCLTSDGVALHAEGDVDGRQGSFTALSVSYGPLPAAMFTVPQGYFNMSVPASIFVR